MQFEITPNEEELINKWHNDIKQTIIADRKNQKDPLKQSDEVYYGAIGGGLSYIFTPTSLGVVVKVKEALTGEELDLTDWDSW